METDLLDAPKQDAVVDVLLGAVRIEAALSLEPILELLAALARDLQADFVPFMPRVAAALSDLVEQGAAPFPIYGA